MSSTQEKSWYIELQPTFIMLFVLITIVILTWYSHNKNQNPRVDTTLTDNNTTKMCCCPCQKKDK